jgi:pyruvate/2-oxoglutarate dehydrogenase complex dihydrolipoamide dehydrogenase (E3) component
MKIKADICIIGAGSGGLSIAAGAAQLGLKTVLIEKSDMGGDCLNTGCVPSKAFLAAAKRAHLHRQKDILGIHGHEPQIDFSGVKQHIADTISLIAPNDSQERFESLGVHVIREAAHFTDKNTVEAGRHTITARHFVVATGSRAVVPPIPGLEEDKVFTNENIFELLEKPDHLLVLGGGPIGIEMAQANSRLGCKVSVFDMGNILPRDDQKNVEVLRRALLSEGVDLHERVAVKEVQHSASGVALLIDKDGQSQIIKGSHLLVAAGRAPNVEGLELEKAGIGSDKRGITVDKRLRTSNRKIFAIGDVAGGPQFTHVAGYHAGIVIRQVCFKMFWSKVNYTALPWVTYTDPELAQVGLTEEDARKKYGEGIKVVTWQFDENDRAVAERATQGQIRVVTDKKGKILGTSIIGAHAGELLGLWALAITAGMKISAIAGMIAPYPTLGEVSKRAAGAWYTPSLFSPRTRWLVRILQKISF